MILWTSHGTNFTDRLPKVAEAICSLAIENALIDGEAIAFRPDGHSDFAARLVRMVGVQQGAEGEIVSLTGQVRAKDEFELIAASPPPEIESSSKPSPAGCGRRMTAPRPPLCARRAKFAARPSRMARGW